MTPLQGGVPIVVDGAVVGAVGVSGAMSAQQDDDIATVAAGALQAPATAGSTPATPWRHRRRPTPTASSVIGGDTTREAFARAGR